MAWYVIVECLRLMIDKDLNPIGDNFYSTEALPPDILRIFARIIEGKINNNTN